MTNGKGKIEITTYPIEPQPQTRGQGSGKPPYKGPPDKKTALVEYPRKKFSKQELDTIKETITVEAKTHNIPYKECLAEFSATMNTWWEQDAPVTSLVTYFRQRMKSYNAK